jgi:hypothetical protein
MSECKITMWAEPMFPGSYSYPMVGRAKCSTHLFSFDGTTTGMCPIGILEQRLEQMEKALMAVALGQPTCFKDGRLAAIEHKVIKWSVPQFPASWGIQPNTGSHDFAEANQKDTKAHSE